MKKSKSITIRTGTVDDFINKVKDVMRSADKDESLKPSQTLIFADPKEFLHFLSDAKIKLINNESS